MCARYKLEKVDDGLAEVFALGANVPRGEGRWNVAPTQTVPVVVEGPRGVRRVVPMRWGLVPSWATDPAVGARMVNARSETAATSPAFRDALRARRCLVPADGFYEWSGTGRSRRPWLIRRRDGGLFALAGLWDVWVCGERALETFAVLTTEPNDLIRPLHDRMPVIVPETAFATWLDPELRDPAALAPLLRPAPADGWEAVPVSRFVNDARHEGPACAAPDPEAGRQGTLL